MRAVNVLPTATSPSMDLIKGFQLGYSRKFVRIRQMDGDEACIRISVLISRAMRFNLTQNSGKES